MSRRYHVFVNNEAGSAGETEGQRHDITAAFRAAGIEATTVAIGVDDLQAAMRDAWKAAPDAIVVAGGDGTVNCAAQVAVDSNIVLGVLPMGTFNHFARDLGIPEELSAAVDFLSKANVSGNGHR